MSDSWTWRYVDAEGKDVQPPSAPTTAFPTQTDAESWLGEQWRELLEAGVEAVHLRENDTEVYGPMGLRPPQ